MNPMKWFHSRNSVDKGNAQQQQTAKMRSQDQYSATAQRKSSFQYHPTVIEVFQSQGCNSCPPTNSLLLSKMQQEDPNVLILDYHVTYWDYLGWKDPFGVRDADDYQRQYAHARGTSRVYTPQVVVNGRAEGVGNSKGSLEKLIEDGNRETNSKPPWLSFSEMEEGILIREAEDALSSTPRQGRVIEVLYDPVPHEVHVPRGENSGRFLTQRSTVRSVKELGAWTSGQGPIRLPRRDGSDGLRRLLIVQEGRGGPIIGVSHT